MSDVLMKKDARNAVRSATNIILKKNKNKFWNQLVIINNNFTFVLMNGIIIKKIEDSGLKKSFLAEKIGVQPNYFYMCMKGIRNLSADKEAKLRELLK
mgnify:FL=1